MKSEFIVSAPGHQGSHSNAQGRICVCSRFHLHILWSQHVLRVESDQRIHAMVENPHRPSDVKRLPGCARVGGVE